MGYYKYVKKLWERPKENPFYRERLFHWRRENTITRVTRPTRIDRARNLGYKAKQGYVVVRTRVPRGGLVRPRPKKGRRGKTSRVRMALSKSYKWIAEERTQKRYPNLEVLNSYWVGKDGKYAWYEVILVDPYHPAIESDDDINWVCARKHTRRVFRGLTSSAKRARGLRKKGKGAEKVRPSLRANNNTLR